MDLETRYALCGDAYLAYQVVGDAPVDLVLVVGASSTSVLLEEPWSARFQRRVTSFARLVAFDQRGTGRSDPVASGRLPTLEQRVDDLRTVMNAAGVERGAVLGTHDGGPVAMMLAATHPERVSHLVLANTWARFAEAPDHPFGYPPELLAEGQRFHHARWGTGASLDVAAPSLAHDPAVRAAWARHEQASASPGQARALTGMVMQLDVREMLPVISVPTLVLHARDNLVVPVAHGRHLAEQIDDARYVELAGADHSFVVGDNEDLLDEVEEFLTGARVGPEPDRALATVLFTDVVGSTERAAELGDRRWRDLLDRHHAAVRRELQRFRGRERGTAGDGFFATFDGPARAIRCGLAVVQAVREVGLEIRAGVHTGEVELRGEEIAGLAVHIGARVSALAGPGEVLVSGTVKDLVVGSDLRFADRGAHRLKGVPDEWRVFAVRGA